MMRFFTYITQHKILLFILMLTASGGVYYMRGDTKATYETTTVKRGTIIQEVSITGRVESDSIASLAFEKSGRVSSRPIPVGMHVRRGDALVRIDSKELETLRSQAKANLDYELVRLAELKKGSRAEEIAISVSRLESARSARDDAQAALLDKLKITHTTADDSVFNKTDHLLDNPRSTNPKVLFPVSDQKLITKIEAERFMITDSGKNMLQDVSDVDATLLRSKKYFSDLKIYFDDLAQAVNSLLLSTAYSQATIDSWKSDVSLARSNLNSAVTNLLAGEQAYRASDSAFTVATNELTLKQAGPTPETIALQEAKIRGVEATLANYDAQINKSVITAPFEGVVTRQEAKLGQTVAPNAILVSLMSDGMFKITANVPEVDVAKLTIGAPAGVTLDAYGSDVSFPAVVSNIDPAETIISGVSTYKITLRFVTQDDRIRSGMTANINVETNKHEQVLFLPLRAVLNGDGRKYVKIPGTENILNEKDVTTGLRGSNGTIEILTGLTEGEVVVTFNK